MAWATSSTPTQNAGLGTFKDANDQYYTIGMGGKNVYIGTGGTPNGVLTAIHAGDWCFDATTGKWYTSDAASTAWTVV